MPLRFVLVKLGMRGGNGRCLAARLHYGSDQLPYGFMNLSHLGCPSIGDLDNASEFLMVIIIPDRFCD